MILSLLLAATSAWAIFLSYKIKLLQKEQERLRREGKEDSKVLFLNSRYASMGETVGNIAHQWKQPLNAIGTIQNSIKAALIFQGEISKEKLLYSVETSFKLLQHLAETIDTFYSFLSQQNSEKMSFSVADELEKVRKITEYSFENSHIALNYELEINPTIQGNANEFTHAMLNLILNAKDAFDTASVERPTITVRVIGEENNSIITVTDNAGGIRLNPVEMVFDLHTTTKEEGSGLGLFMTKNIIENRFGGKIFVKNIKGGACFTIELPYSEYGENYADTIPDHEKHSLERINQLSRKVIELEEVEKALKKWADIFKKARWGIAIHVGTSNYFDSTNDAFNSMYGYTPQELREISVPDLFPPETLSVLSRVQQRAFENGYVAFETINKRRDGSTFPVSVELIVVKDDEGEILYHMANIWDMSAHKEAEEKLLLKQFALDTIHEAVYLIDENSMFYYVNDGACKALGYTKEELLSMGVVDIDPNCSVGWWGIHWEDIKRLKTVLGQASHRKKDGSVFPIEVSSNYFEYNGVGYSLAVARDITERLQLETQKENERMRLFFERQLVGMAITSPEKGWIHTNEKLRQMLGYTQEELTNRTWVEMTYPEDLAPDLEQFTKLLNDEIEDYMLEKRFIRKNGTVLYTNLAVSCVRNDDRSVNYVLALLEDISDRKAMEASQKEANDRYIQILDNSIDVIYLIEVTTDGRFVYVDVNAAYEEVTGIPRDIVIGLDVKDIEDETFRTILIDKFSSCLRAGEKTDYTADYPFSSGIRTFHSILLPIRDNSGRIVRIVGAARDITEKQQMEFELALREQELRSLADSSPGMMGAFHLRPDGSAYIPYVSPNIIDLFGLTPEEVREDVTPLMALTHPEDATRIVESISESARTMNIWHEQYRIIHPFKGERWMESNTKPELDLSGDIVWYGYIHDITERKKIEKQLTRSETSLKEAQKIAKIGSWELELPSQKLTWSDETYRIFEVDQEQTDELHTIFYDAVHPDDREIVKKVFEESLKTKQPFEIVHRIVTDGRIKYVLESCETQYNPDGDPVLSIGTVQDITERKKAEELIQTLNATLEKRVIERTSQLEEAVTKLHDEITQKNMLQQEQLLLEERLSKIAASVPGVNYIFEQTVDRIVRFIYLAPTFEELFGLSADVAMDNFDVVMEHIHTEDRETIRHSIIATARDFTNWHEEFRIFHPHKGMIWIEGQSSPELQNDGSILWYGFFHNITERKRIEKALKESEETFRAIVENSPDVISRYDLQMHRTYVNPMMQFLLGKPVNEILGKTPREFSPLPDIDSFEQLFNAVVRGKNEIEYESLYTAPWGEKRWGNQRLVPEFDENRNVISVMVIGRDMTERKNTERQLKLLETALNSSAEAVYINNKELSIIYVNNEACRMLGYSHDELLNMKIVDIDAKYTLQEIEEIIKTKIREGKIIFETQHRKKDGSVIDVEIAGSFFIHEDDEILISLVKEIS